MNEDESAGDSAASAERTNANTLVHNQPRGNHAQPDPHPLVTAAEGYVLEETVSDLDWPPAITSPSANSPTRELHGHIDEVSRNEIIGWAWDPEAPDDRICLELTENGRCLVTAIADIERPGLADIGIGDGRHEFRLTLHPELLSKDAHRLHLRCADTHAQVPGSPLTIPTEAQVADPTESATDQAEEEIKIDDIVTAEEFAVQIQHDPVSRRTLYKLFDSDFYQSQVGAVDDPLEHYMRFGWKVGASPHPMFDTVYYQFITGEERYKDPLTHFFEIGQYKNLAPHPLFSVSLYLKSRPDVLRARANPILHYLEFGWRETDFPSLFFSDRYYEEQCPGVRAAGLAPVIHYLTIGYKEGRRPHREFDPKVFSKYANLAFRGDPFTSLLKSLFALRTEGNQHTEVRISIVILNLEKTLTTLQCLYFLRQNTDMAGVEVIVVDNGSSPDQFALLCKYATGCNIVRIGVNRGFGEGNNIGVESARGEVLCFLNNDTFVTPGWLARLEAVLRSDSTIGAVGPRFLYPDGSLQEAGAMIGPDGTAIQRGKHLDPRDPLFSHQSDVDYVSAATLLVWKNLFLEVLGYDLCWDPAYYEDADLSLKLRLLGKRTVYVPTVEIVHLENATSSDQSLNLRLHNVVRANRLKFVSRWGHFLSGAPDTVRQDLTNFYVPEPPTDKPKTAALYTPYPLTPGGGERYLLSLAVALKDNYNCVLLTVEPYSRLRLLTLGRELGLDVSHVHLNLWRKTHDLEPFDLFICMGNEVLPPVHPRGRLSFYHCQFPFALQSGHFVRDWGKLHGYRGYVVNSNFTRRHVLSQGAEFALALPPINVLYPPVPQLIKETASVSTRCRGSILHVGRFAPGGHCKRQDVMIDVFKKLIKTCGQDIELNLAGALGGSSEDREYLLFLQDAARGLPIQFHVNMSASKLRKLYFRCSIYWHITGISNEVYLEPEKFEHFGITVAESMSAGLVPIVLRFGGPSEIINDGETGFLIASLEELEERTCAVVKLEDAALRGLRTEACKRAGYFSPKNFKRRLIDLLSIDN